MGELLYSRDFITNRFMLIHARPYGRLGNQLFLLAHLVAFSREHDVPIRYPSFLDYADYFESWRGNWLGQYPFPAGQRVGFRTWRKILKWSHYRAGKIVHRVRPNGRSVGAIFLEEGEPQDMASPEFIAAANEKALFLQGYLFRDLPTLQKHSAEVRKLFLPIETHQRKVTEHITAARADCDLLVGFHVRRGDYREFAGGQYFYSLDQYRLFLDRVAGQLKDKRVKFLICSDETIPSEVWKPHSVVRGPGQFIQDMYALAECDLIVGPPSTFSGWASFYGQKPLLHLNSKDVEIRLDRFEVMAG